MRFLYVLLALPLLGWTFLDPVAQKNEEGNSLFEKGEYDAALKCYLEAQQSAQNLPELYFNAGDALYKQGKYDEAGREFERATQGSSDLSAKAYYNLGNALFRQEKFQKAIEVYKTSLEINPEDQATKINLEIALGHVLSYYAKQLKKQADELVSQYEFRRARDLMINGLQVDPTVRFYQTFIQRLQEVVDIEDGL